jgi:hypothetical protein
MKKLTERQINAFLEVFIGEDKEQLKKEEKR